MKAAAQLMADRPAITPCPGPPSRQSSAIHSGRLARGEDVTRPAGSVCFFLQTVRGLSCPSVSAGDNSPVADSAGDAVRRIGIRLSALAQDGLAYAPFEYDLDRYRQVGRLAAELLAVVSGLLGMFPQLGWDWPTALAAPTEIKLRLWVPPALCAGLELEGLGPADPGADDVEVGNQRSTRCSRPGGGSYGSGQKSVTRVISPSANSKNAIASSARPSRSHSNRTTP
jgi:hypothetical protein